MAWSETVENDVPKLFSWSDELHFCTLTLRQCSNNVNFQLFQKRNAELKPRLRAHWPDRVCVMIQVRAQAPDGTWVHSISNDCIRRLPCLLVCFWTVLITASLPSFLREPSRRKRNYEVMFVLCFLASTFGALLTQAYCNLWKYESKDCMYIEETLVQK